VRRSSLEIFSCADSPQREVTKAGRPENESTMVVNLRFLAGGGAEGRCKGGGGRGGGEGGGGGKDGEEG
jgi:hypothetical protein